MNLNQSRIGILSPGATPLWAGTANGAQSATFVLAVTTVSGTLAAGMAGLVMVRAGADMVRIKSISGANITLAENAIPFVAGNALAIYELRLPFPRYQRLVSTTVYKDYDVAFPATWQHIAPPAAIVSPEAAWATVGVITPFDASASRAMVYGATADITATWDATGWATTAPSGTSGGVVNCYCDVTPTLAGFHYLKVTLTDEFGGATNHYIPVWVDPVANEIISMSMNWGLNNGWKADGSVDESLTILRYSPVAVADLETHDILLFGFWRPNSTSGDFGVITSDFEILSPLAAAEWLHGYPFIVTDIAAPGSDVPNDWAEVGQLTVARAVWFLLVWHSMIPELININLGEPSIRRIAGQAFTAGTLRNLLDQVVGSAFYCLRIARTGGIEMQVDPLHADASAWAGLTTLTLTTLQRSAAYTLQNANPRYADVRLSGVYLAVGGDYAPAIARCPVHPEPWGNGTGEVTGLAPLDATELLAWAGRHLSIENLSVELDMDVYTDVDPAQYARLISDVPSATTIAIDSVRMQYKFPEWNETVSGRTYETAQSAISMPVPAPISVPGPATPPITPPVEPLPPAPEPCQWPLRLYVATRTHGIYYTENFSGPDGSQPTWAQLAGTDAYTIKNTTISPLTESIFAVCVVSALNEVMRWTGSAWENILTDAEATTLIGEGAAVIGWVYVDPANGYVYVVATGQYTSHLLRSTTDGARSGGAHSFVDYGEITGWVSSSYIGNLIIKSTGLGMVALNRTGGGNSGRVYSGTVGASDWTRSNSLGLSTWGPAVYYDAHNDRIYSESNTGVLMRLLTDFITWEQPVGTTDLVGILPKMTVSFPCFYAWSTGLHVTVGAVTSDYENSIQWSDDQWATFTASGDCGRNIDMLTALADAPGNLILGRYADAGAVGEYHVIYVSDDLGATQPVERAGADPNNAGTTVSIPYDCGGIAQGGILIPPDYCEV